MYIKGVNQRLIEFLTLKNKRFIGCQLCVQAVNHEYAFGQCILPQALCLLFNELNSIWSKGYYILFLALAPGSILA